MTGRDQVSDEDPAPGRLARRLGLGDAVFVGLGSMIGAGVFAAFGPAARAAGTGLLVGLLLAAIVAYANATSSAALAARYPESGGAYVYGRERLGEIWGFLAGWGFVVGKTASCAAMALTFGEYVWPDARRAVAAVVVVLCTGIDLAGVQRTARVARLLVLVVLAVLAFVCIAGFGGCTAATSHVFPVEGSARGILQSAGILFFAFAGYARLATLGEEVRDPTRVIPRAIPIALGIALLVYAAVAVAALAAVGPGALAAATAPLAAVVEAGRFDAWVPVVRIGAAVASGAVLLSLLAGVSRTILAMARRRELPSGLAAVHPARSAPQRATLAVGVGVLAIVVVADIRGAIGFSAFAVLVYYAVANAAAWTLVGDRRVWMRVSIPVGFVGCLVLGATLPAASVLAGVGVLGVGLLGRAIARRRFPDG